MSQVTQACVIMSKHLSVTMAPVASVDFTPACCHGNKLSQQNIIVCVCFCGLIIIENG